MMNRRFVLVLGLAVLLALMVSGVFYQIASSAGLRGRERVEKRSVVVATSPVPLGATIKASDLKQAYWPADSIPPGAFTKVEEVVDRATTGNILPNEPVLEPRLAPRGSGLGLSPMIPPGMRAVSVRVNDVISVAGFVLPGSRVDVMVTGAARGGDNGSVTRTILSNIQILSAGKNIQPDAKGQPENVPVVTLLVNPSEAEILTLAANEGRIQLALRNNIDASRSVGRGALAAELYGGAVEKPRPALRPVRRLITVAAPPPAPPPPPPQIELIRGDRRSTEIMAASQAGLNDGRK